MNNPKVSIIVPIFNGKEHTLKFLESIKKLNYDNFELIIIDDASTDGSAEAISEHFPDTKILKGDGNFWWAKSMNHGVRYALKNRTEYILTLNNDNEVDENIISAHLNCIKKYDKAVLGAKVLDKKYSNKVINAWGKRNLFLPPNFNFIPYGASDNSEYSNEREADAIAGMGTFMPSKIFKEIGLYNDKNCPQYIACIEHSLRAKKQGYKIIFNPEAKLWNDSDSTWKYPRKITLQTIKDLLFHKRSGYLLKANFYLYYHYWPKLIWFIPFTLLYLKCFTGLFILSFPFGSKLISLFKKDKI